MSVRRELAQALAELELGDGGGGDVSIRTTVVRSNADIDSQVVLVTREMAQAFAEAWPLLLSAVETDRA